MAPIKRPPLLPPWIASFSGRVYFSLCAMEPRRRLGIAHIAKQKRVIFQGEHLLNSRYFWNWYDCFAFTVQPKAPDLRWTAEQIANVNRVGGGSDVLDDRFASRY